VVKSNLLIFFLFGADTRVLPESLALSLVYFARLPDGDEVFQD